MRSHTPSRPGRLPLWALALALSALTATGRAGTGDWTVAEYLERLPKQFKTYVCDCPWTPAEVTLIDKRNGYAAYRGHPAQEAVRPVFEMALFHSAKSPPLVVASNSKYDFVCTEYETFFLRRDGDRWIDVRRKVLPKVSLKLFWESPRAAERVLAITKGRSAVSLHFEPPRAGTRMKVTPEICEPPDDLPEATYHELRRLIETARPVYLDWDAARGVFKRVR